jgi:hypothetical protein
MKPKPGQIIFGSGIEAAIAEVCEAIVYASPLMSESMRALHAPLQG